MADRDSLPARGIGYRALVDASGVAIGGTATLDQLRRAGMRPICQVDAVGVDSGGTGATIADLYRRGIPFFCAVDANGIESDTGATLSVLASRGIPARCAVDALGIADGGVSIAQLRARGIDVFCPLDESGNATSLQAIPAQFSLFVAGQSLAEYPFIRGTPRVARNLAADLRSLFDYSTSGTITGYDTGKLFHDGSAQAAEDWTVRIDNLAAGGSALLDISQAGSQIATSNYWWNTQNNTAATGNGADTADTPGPLWRALITAIEARVTAEFPPAAFVWSQGTTDMTADVNVLATYKTVLTALFNAVRTAAGATIPIFILRIGRHQTATDAGAENIRQVQREISSEMAKIYFGAEEYPYRMAVAGSYAAGTTNGSNVVTIANTTGLTVNDGIEGAEIPVGAYITTLTANTSVALSRLVNGVALPATATATNASATVYRVDNVHLYPGADGTQPLDTAGGTTHNGTDGFYAVFKALARRIGDVFGADGVAASQGPRVTGIASVYSSGNRVRVNLSHDAGTDFTIGDTTGWRLEVDNVAQTLVGVEKVSATQVDILTASAISGTTAEVQYGYGAMNRADYSKFIVDNASPVAFPIQALAPVNASISTPAAGAGPLSVSFLNSQVDATDLTQYAFSGTGATDGRIFIGIGARGSASFTIPLVTINGVPATSLVQVTSGSGGVARTALFVADVPAGASGGIVIRMSVGVLRCGIGLWKATGYNANSVIHASGSSTADPATASFAAPANGAVIGYGFAAHSTTVTGAWSGVTGITESFDQAIEGTTMFHTGAIATGLSAGTIGPQVDWSATPANGAGAVFASFGP